MSRLRVRVSFDVEIEPEAWATEYGTSADPDEVTADVRDYCEAAAVDQLVHVGMWAGAPR